jgi:hypothetical protein
MDKWRYPSRDAHINQKALNVFVNLFRNKAGKNDDFLPGQARSPTQKLLNWKCKLLQKLTVYTEITTKKTSHMKK